MMNLTCIYTRTGDAGNTRLPDNAEVPKTDLRAETYGAIDRTNLNLALAVTHGGLPERAVEVLALTRNKLFDVGAGPSTPLHPSPQYPPLCVEQFPIDQLEEQYDRSDAELPSLRSFILPGGSPAATQLHITYTACRRAGRMAWRAAQAHGIEPSTGHGEGEVNLLAIIYLNRLSDLLFNMCRTVADPERDVLWVPGMDRQPPEKRRSRMKK